MSRPPFESVLHLPRDLGIGAWIIFSVLAADAWAELRRIRIVRI